MLNKPAAGTLIAQFIDTSRCIGCKACQVSCKQWHGLPAEETRFTGSYTNPPEVSGRTLTRIGFTEFESHGTLKFLMFKKQCLHCTTCKCATFCPSGVIKTAEGFVVFTDQCTVSNLVKPRGTDQQKIAAFIAACPHDIPRYNCDLGRFVKCDFCYDRFGTDKLNKTSCELTCPPGAIKTGKKSDIVALANARLREVRPTQPNAVLYGTGAVIWLLTTAFADRDLISLDFDLTSEMIA